MNEQDMAQIKRLAAGRLFLIMSRPPQPGDVADYHRIRDIFMQDQNVADHRPNWVRDRTKGAQGD